MSFFDDDDDRSRDANGNLRPLALDQFDIDGLRFGGPFDKVLLDSFDPGEASWDVQDQDNPFAGNVQFGRDYLRGPTLGFEAFTNGYNRAEAVDAYDHLGRFWRNSHRRDVPGNIQILRYRIGPETRRVYGRGRKFWYGIDERLEPGTVPISMTFKMMENAFYADEARSLEIPIYPPSIGGLTAPLTSPLTTTGTGPPRSGSIEKVGGTTSCPFRVYFSGPVTNPLLTGPGWKIGLNGSIAAGRIICVSTYPGQIGAWDQNGVNWSKLLSAATSLTQARLPYGPASVNYTGTDITGTSWMRLVWRPAYTTM